MFDQKIKVEAEKFVFSEILSFQIFHDEFADAHNKTRDPKGRLFYLCFFARKNNWHEHLKANIFWMREKNGINCFRACRSLADAESLLIFIWIFTEGWRMFRVSLCTHINFGFRFISRLSIGLLRRDYRWCRCCRSEEKYNGPENLCNMWSIAINLAFSIQGHYFDTSSVTWNRNEADLERKEIFFLQAFTFIPFGNKWFVHFTMHYFKSIQKLNPLTLLSSKQKHDSTNKWCVQLARWRKFKFMVI